MINRAGLHIKERTLLPRLLSAEGSHFLAKEKGLQITA
jgi:hypothetical protein